MILDPYSGPRGWSVGLRMLGLNDIGIEWDAAACATAAAAGFRTIRADVARFPLEPLVGRVKGVIMSPPCPMFSTAGRCAGRAVMAELHAAIIDALAGRHTIAAHTRVMARKLRAAYLAGPGRHTRATASAKAWHDARQAAHVVQPARWLTALRPEWIALEQVPPVLPLWQTYARELRARGWSTWAGILNAADYGVPQTRRRAFLIARTDGQPVTAPEPTHCRGGALTMFGELRPWVSMADALGWTDVTVHHQRGRGMAERHGERPGRPSDEPAPTIEGGAQRRLVLDRRQQNPDGSPVPPVDCDTRPAPTLTAEAGAKGVWVFHRPATTVAGDPRLSGPGRNDPDIPGSQYGENSLRLTICDALILQGFPPDYPVQGTRTKQFEQVGNAVPPPLAAAVISSVTGTHPAEAAA